MPIEAARLKRLRTIIAALKPPVAVVVTQVDPDAIAAAVAMTFLLSELRPDLSVQIITCGTAGHPQNRSLVNRCNLKSILLPITTLQHNPDITTILVDSSSSMDNRLPAGLLLDPVIVIDHHRGSDLVDDEDHFVWVEDVGASCTLITELLEAMEQTIAPETNLPLLLAMGIYTDTRGLISAGARDRRAYDTLIAAVDPSDFKSVIDYPLPESHFANFRHALLHHEQRGSRLIASVGSIHPEDGDDLSTFADYFLRKDGVTLVVVWGIIGTTVRISARNANLSAPLDEFLQARFGDDSGAKLTPDGKGEGGARLKLELGLWMSHSNREQVEALVSGRLKELIFSDKV